MKPQRHLLLFGSLLCAITTTITNAQSIGPSTINAAGKTITAGGFVHEYAIGQVMAGNTFSGSGFIVTPDVLQPDATTGISTPGIPASSLSVFPSPMENTLFIQPAFSAGGTMHYMLYDAAGKLISEQQTELKTGTEQQSLQVTQLAIGQYVLQVQWTQSGTTYTSGYKLQKLQ